MKSRFLIFLIICVYYGQAQIFNEYKAKKHIFVKAAVGYEYFNDRFYKRFTPMQQLDMTTYSIINPQSWNVALGIGTYGDTVKANWALTYHNIENKIQRSNQSFLQEYVFQFNTFGVLLTVPFYTLNNKSIIFQFQSSLQFGKKLGFERSYNSALGPPILPNLKRIENSFYCGTRAGINVVGKIANNLFIQVNALWQFTAPLNKFYKLYMLPFNTGEMYWRYANFGATEVGITYAF